MLLLKQDTIGKIQGDKTQSKLEKNFEFEAGGNKEYKVKIIIDNAIYGK